MKINPIGNGFPKPSKATKVIAVMVTASLTGAYLLDRKVNKKK